MCALSLAGDDLPNGRHRRGLYRIAGRAAKIATILHREGVSALTRRLWSLGRRQLVAPLWLRNGARWSWAEDGRPVFLLVHHGGGGGIGRHVRDLAAMLQRAGIRPVLAARGPRGSLLWEEPGSGARVSWALQTGATHQAIAQAIEALRPVHAHIHSSMKIPDSLFELLAERKISCDWTIHDYYPVCPRAHLDQEGGRYCGEPGEAGCHSCLARLGDYRGRDIGESIEAFRLRQAGYLKRARRVFAPSHDARKRLERHVPGVSVVVQPHLEGSVPSLQVAARFRPGARVRVAVLGTVTALKGSRILQACAEDARAHDLPVEFVVLGRTDRDASLTRTRRVIVTGPYREEEVDERLKRLGCHLAFFPSIVPETYMYTLSIALRTGLLPVCFDLGAQAERVRAGGQGLVLRLDSSPSAINLALIEAAGSQAAILGPGRTGTGTEPRDLLGAYYGFSDKDRDRLGLPAREAVTMAPGSRFVRRDSHARIH